MLSSGLKLRIMKYFLDFLKKFINKILLVKLVIKSKKIPKTGILDHNII